MGWIIVPDRQRPSLTSASNFVPEGQFKRRLHRSSVNISIKSCTAFTRRKVISGCYTARHRRAKAIRFGNRRKASLAMEKDEHGSSASCPQLKGRQVPGLALFADTPWAGARVADSPPAVIRCRARIHGTEQRRARPRVAGRAAVSLNGGAFVAGAASNSRLFPTSVGGSLDSGTRTIR
jgi:hypothetical protein